MHTHRTQRPCLGDSLRGAIAAGQPNRQAKSEDGVEVDDIALVIDGLAELVHASGPSGRRIVAASDLAFDDEPIGPRAVSAGQTGRQIGRRDDRQHSGGRERRARIRDHRRRAERHPPKAVARPRAHHSDVDGDVLVAGKSAHEIRDLSRAACAA